MGRVMRPIQGVVVAVICVGSLTGCTRDDSSTVGTSAGCAPIPGPQLVILADDKKLQAANNIVPAVHAKSATEALMTALDKASAALTAERLVALNKATDVDGMTPKAAAEQFASSVKLTEGIARGSGGGRITVGASNISESQTLGFVYQITLNAAGYDARLQPAGNRDQYEPALEAGDLDVVPEYLGTLTEFLNQKVNGANAVALTSSDVDKTVAALETLGSKRGLEFGKPAPATAQNAFAVTKALADMHGLQTLSDLATKCSGRATVLAGPEDCPRSAFCQPGLEATYHLQIGRFSSLDAGGPKTKEALISGAATVGLMFSSDASLAG
jgi:osmoprotectant transport system substrate-binding protein